MGSRTPGASTANSASVDEDAELSELEDGGEPEERLEQQNIVLSSSDKAHLARLAGYRGMSLRRYLSEVVVKTHIANEREELRQVYMRDMARLEQSMDELDAAPTTVKRKRK